MDNQYFRFYFLNSRISNIYKTTNGGIDIINYTRDFYDIIVLLFTSRILNQNKQQVSIRSHVVMIYHLAHEHTFNSSKFGIQNNMFLLTDFQFTKKV